MTDPMTITPDEAEAMVALALEQAAEWLDARSVALEGAKRANDALNEYSDPPLTGEACADRKQSSERLQREINGLRSDAAVIRALRPDAIDALARLREADRAEIERLAAQRDALQVNRDLLMNRVMDLMARVAELEADRVKVAETALRMAGDVAVATTEEPLDSHAGDSRAFTIAKRVLAITPAAVLAQADKDATPSKEPPR